MKTKINKISLGSLLGVLAIAIFAAIAWSTVAGNAFATDDEATLPESAELQAQEAAAPEAQPAAEPANDQTTISFSCDGLDAGVKFEFELFKNEKIDQDYQLGSPLAIETGAEVKYDLKDSHNHNGGGIYVYDSATEYNFFAYAPIGYDFVSVTPNVENISDKTNFVYHFIKYTGDYTVNIQAYSSQDEKPVDNYNITLRDSNFNVIATDVTKEGGKCSFTLPVDKALCTVVGEGDKWGDFSETVEAKLYDPEKDHACFVEIQCEPLEDLNMMLKSNDPAHDYFSLYIKLYDAEDPSHVLLEDYINKESIKTKSEIPIPIEFVVNDDGALLYEGEYSEMCFIYTISPFHKDGYEFGHWSIDFGDGVKQEFNKGDKIQYNSQTQDFIGEVFYTQGSGPEPAPVPTPGEEVSAAAQTGDSTVALPLAILAIAAAGATALSLRRKSN